MAPEEEKDTQADAAATGTNQMPGVGRRKAGRLEEAKSLPGYRAVLNRKNIGSGVLVFVRMGIASHRENS